MPLADAELSERQPAGVGGPWLRLPSPTSCANGWLQLTGRRGTERLYHEVLAEVERGLFGLVLSGVAESTGQQHASSG